MSGHEPAPSINAMALVLTIGATLILLLVSALAVLALRRHRRGTSPRAWLGGGGVLTMVVLLALYAYTAIETARLAPAEHADELVIGITGHQWWWEIRYRDPDPRNGQRNGSGARDIVTANELHLPAGRRVRLALASDDVIHSFWVPALAGKRDLVPGRVTHLALRVERPGRFRGECAEFCGEQHARMPIHVIAHTPAGFDAWLTAQRADAAVPVNEAQRSGARALIAQGCVACHVVRGLHVAMRDEGTQRPPLDEAAPGRTSDEGALKAPDLTHVASRTTIAGVLPNDAPNRLAWITHAQTLKPGARMASYGHLDTVTLESINAYLEHLR